MIDELVADVLADFEGDEGEPLVMEAYVHRQAERALPQVAVDLGIAYVLGAGEVFPEMPAGHRELWALQTKVMLCRHLRMQAANRVSFASGDKRMDRSREAANWASLEKALADDYSDRVRRVNPAIDPAVLQMDVVPAVYERGAEVDP